MRLFSFATASLATFVLAVACSSSSSSSGSGKALDCTVLTGNNCWKSTLAAAASCLPA